MMSMFTATPEDIPSAPMARFAFTIGSTGLVVNVDGNGSRNTSSWTWNCGGGTLTAAGAAATCDYTSVASSGTNTFTISLTASGAAGSDTKSTPVYLKRNNSAPVAGTPAFTLGFSGNIASVTDNFSDPDGDALSIFVNWGDGLGSWATYTSGTHSTFTHTYAPGTYTIYLSANDGRGGNVTVKAGTVTPTNIVGSVSGVVSDPTTTNTPLVSGAIVTLYAGTTTIASAATNSVGYYTMPNIPLGSSYILKTRKGGYLFADVQTATVNGAITQAVSSGSATLSGSIDNGNGVSVELRDSTCTVTLDVVISYGTYIFKKVATSIAPLTTIYCVYLPSGSGGHAIQWDTIDMNLPGPWTVNLTYQ
jgi:hypothetical protein